VPSLLALATLGGATEIEMILIAKAQTSIVDYRHRWPRQVRKVTLRHNIGGITAYKDHQCIMYTSLKTNSVKVGIHEVRLVADFFDHFSGRGTYRMSDDGLL